MVLPAIHQTSDAEKHNDSVSKVHESVYRNIVLLNLNLYVHQFDRNNQAYF